MLRLGTRRSGDDRYEGVIRDGSRVIAACGHPHHNRDTSSQANGLSARDCITSLARAARDPGYAAHEAGRVRRSMDGYIRAWATTTSNAAALRENAVRAADAFLSRLPEIAALTGGRPICGYKDHIAVPPPVPENVTCLYCRESISPTRYTADKGWIYWHTAGQGYMNDRCPARECNSDDYGRHIPDLPAAAAAGAP